MLQVWGYCLYTFGFTRASDDEDNSPHTFFIPKPELRWAAPAKKYYFMNDTTKGKTNFTSEEIKVIRDLIIKKCNTSPSKQKDIRKKMRNLGFYITDFTNNITSVEEFDSLVSAGRISCKDRVDNKDSANQKDEIFGGKTKLANVPLKTEDTKIGLPALVGQNPKILILGTLPGNESIQKQEYYAKSSNRFWKIIYALFNEEKIPKEYAAKQTFLRNHDIALWDIIYEADREGSLDSEIDNEKPNDIKSFLEQYPTIEVIAFNGKEAQKMFKKHFSDLLSSEKWKSLLLLSSSGANQQFSISKMIENWSKIFPQNHLKY